MAFAYHECKKAFGVTIEGPRVDDPSRLKANGDQQVVCSMKPSTYTEAHSTYMLVNVAMVPGDYTNDGKRRLTVAAKNGIPITNGGRAVYIAIVDTAHSVLLVARKCELVLLTTPGTVDIPAWNCFF